MRGLGHPSRVDLVFTRKENEIKVIKYSSSLGKTDHVTIKLKTVVLFDTLSNTEDCQKGLSFKNGN